MLIVLYYHWLNCIFHPTEVFSNLPFHCILNSNEWCRGIPMRLLDSACKDAIDYFLYFYFCTVVSLSNSQTRFVTIYVYIHNPLIVCKIPSACGMLIFFRENYFSQVLYELLRQGFAKVKNSDPTTYPLLKEGRCL